LDGSTAPLTAATKDIEVAHVQIVREAGLRFGGLFANALKRCQPRAGRFLLAT
jgi:hypothetical protein